MFYLYTAEKKKLNTRVVSHKLKLSMGTPVRKDLKQKREEKKKKNAWMA